MARRDRRDVPPPDVTGGERDVLLGFLDYVRESVAAKVDGAPESTVQSLTDEYRSVTTRANDAILGCADLESPCARPIRQGGPTSMRWALTHMIEETARHAGHMDILRELIDGATGR
jgi:hypothetical protein